MIVEDHEFAESRAASEANTASYATDYNNAYNSAPAPQQSAPPANFGADSADGFMNIPDGIDEELPFQ